MGDCVFVASIDDDLPSDIKRCSFRLFYFSIFDRPSNTVRYPNLHNMHLSNVASLFSVLSFVCASSLAVRSATDVERDIATIQSQVDKVDGDIKAFTGSLDQALALVSDFRTLEINVDAGTKDATDAGVFSPGDSDNIYKSLKSLTDHIGTALTDGLEKVRVADLAWTLLTSLG